MKRYQVYLNPHAVSVLDEFEIHTDISRSKLIREALERVTNNLAKIFAATKIPPQKKTILDSMIGSIKVKGKGKTNFSQTVDDIYLAD